MNAVDVYVQLIHETRDAVERIAEYLDDHGEIDPDSVNWGNVGFMDEIKNRLTNVRDMIDRTGEYSPEAIAGDDWENQLDEARHQENARR